MTQEGIHGDLGRHREEETVADTAESLLTFENAALPLIVMAREGVVVMANRAMRALLAYDFELVGKSIHELVVADSVELTRSWDELLSGPDEARPEARIVLRCGDGSDVTVRASSVRVTDANGTVRYIVARAMADRP